MCEIKKICVIGAGNIGVAEAVDLSQNEDVKVTVLTSRADTLCLPFKKIDSDTNEEIVGKNISVTSDYSLALSDCDLLIITVPSFLIKSTMEKVELFFPRKILFVPGYGGKEFFCQRLIEKGCVIGGLERVTHIARLCGPNVVRTSKKKEIHLACLKDSDTEPLCSATEALFGIKCNPVKNYLTVTLTPSNPILHTSRLYGMFHGIDFKTPIKNQMQFYADWDDFSSEILFEMDNELQKICRAFTQFDLTGVVSLPLHYDSDSVPALTKKISSIPSFQGILSPLKKSGDYYFLDSESRYFKEDFMYGLCDIKGFARIAGIETPWIDKVLRWYEKISGEEFWGKDRQFNGKSLLQTGIPQNFGLHTIDDINRFYGASK